MIEIKNINKSFGDNQVIFDVSAQFQTGHTNLIIGQSGHGKTVLLKTMVGLHSIDSGKIIYSDKVFSEMDFDDQKSIRKEIGMLFQGSALFDSLTVEENIRFPLDMFAEQSKEEKRERVNFCLKRVKLENVNHLYPSEISGGMQKRVAIARAIALNPKYLFCDEPNSGLDPKTSIVIDNLIYEITKEYGITTIINTHDMNSVMGIGEKIIFIYEGRKLWEGDKEDLLSASEERLNDFVFASELFKRIKKNEK
ncbi:phospholipid/cholesterol/gamma-HCH transport system ATP-binding protein [Saccharicrinis carchari]|uniref:Phospholipid/cholesterol/gamma-HCH transport system ATP-binding protein n=1 Tax=Saccharicrinis carchari TaxID=1168039 RepID=A0A521CS37_SACCC|nr:ATP-binding cassette domain-containing protein [Saccharicrinis carchari]SMO62287.1 phospholipid/cholesterol/gamma-HCH transport system ATP-binding protein [Saccharicrinis carchari]